MQMNADIPFALLQTDFGEQMKFWEYPVSAGI